MKFICILAKCNKPALIQPILDVFGKVYSGYKLVSGNADRQTKDKYHWKIADLY